MNKFENRIKQSAYMLQHKGRSFFAAQWAGGVILVLCVVVAMLLANMDATREAYHHFLTSNLGITVGPFDFEFDVEKFICDGLMMIFFFTVGLEIKREIKAGHLSSFKKAILPIAGAVGGMVVPALIYSALNSGTEFQAGWGIPMATDIAFAIGILSLVGDRVPVSLKVFLTALAIVDDLGAIIVIALFYGSQLNFGCLLAGFGVLLIAVILNKMKVYSYLPYIILSIILWFLFYYSGVHATIAGVLMAMTIPSRPKYDKQYFTYKLKYFVEDFKLQDKENTEVLGNPQQFQVLNNISSLTLGTASLAQRMEHLLNPFVTFFIMPVFALANSGVVIEQLNQLNIFATTQGLGIYLGLLLGKPIGITLLSWLFVKIGLASKPEGTNWRTFFGVACLGGIGFTMSIFIDTLAFAGNSLLIDDGKIAIFLASLSAAILGSVLLCSKSKIKDKTIKNNY